MAEAGAFGFAGSLSHGKVVNGLDGPWPVNQGTVDGQSGRDHRTEFPISGTGSLL